VIVSTLVGPVGGGIPLAARKFGRERVALRAAVSGGVRAVRAADEDYLAVAHDVAAAPVAEVPPGAAVERVGAGAAR
jgi:hypothetical protein